MSSSESRKSNSSALLGAAFLMATSAIGPGFITQTTVFTEKLLASFGFIILCSILIDIVVQLNVWRIVSASGMRTQDLANKSIPGSGYVLSLLIVLGGLAFNIGNVAGAGLGIEVMTGLPLTYGVIGSAIISIFIFVRKEAGTAMDFFAKILGFVMIALTAYIAITSNPPLKEAAVRSFYPEVIHTTAIITLVGGTVGGYISFAGVHRLLDAGISGPQSIKQVSWASVRGILIASTMRILLFLAALGVVYSGTKLATGNPAADVFRFAAGNIGYRIFGLVLWAAAITSVVGSAYTSVSFLKTFHKSPADKQTLLVIIFIVVSTIVFLIVGRPVKILVIVGALNALILPFALAIILYSASKSGLMKTYKHPPVLTIFGALVAIILSYMSVKTITTDLASMWD
jgi:Mn2+/Fe2+ NRAMP family transporter